MLCAKRKDLGECVFQVFRWVSQSVSPSVNECVNGPQVVVCVWIVL